MFCEILLIAKQSAPAFSPFRTLSVSILVNILFFLRFLLLTFLIRSPILELQDTAMSEYVERKANANE